MYQFCKQIVKQKYEVPAIIDNINKEIAFKQNFGLNQQLIILNQKIAYRDTHNSFYQSLALGCLFTFGTYIIYDVYFSKTEKQIKKLKLSIKCYLESLYQSDLQFVFKYLEQMNTQQLKNTGFLMYLLSQYKVSKYNYEQLKHLYNLIAQILLSQDVYIQSYAQKYCKLFGYVIDFAISNDIQLSDELLQPSLLGYLYSQNILIEIQSLYILSQYQLTEQRQIELLKLKYLEDIESSINETNELFTMLQQNRGIEDYGKFKQIYQETLQTQKRKLLKQVAIKQKL